MKCVISIFCVHNIGLCVISWCLSLQIVARISKIHFIIIIVITSETWFINHFLRSGLMRYVLYVLLWFINRVNILKHTYFRIPPKTRPFTFSSLALGLAVAIVSEGFQVLILTTWTISSNSHPRNTTWEIRDVLSCPNLTLSHMGTVPFENLVLSFGTFCHIWWKIQTTLTYSKIISRDDATVNSVLCLMCFEITRGFLSAFILFVPLYSIRHHLVIYTSIYNSVFCLSPYTMYIYYHLCTCLSSLFPF